MFTKATGVNKKLKVLVYGQSGSGKTHLALTFPRPAVIDCEGGTELFGGRFDFDVLRTKDLDEVLKALESINPAQYDTVVVDPVTVLWQVMMEAGQVAAERRALKQKRNPDEATLTPRDWGIIKRKVNALYTRLVNLPCHVVVCGRVKDVNETRGTEVVKTGERVDAEKSTEYLFDIIVKLEVGKDGKRTGIVEKDRSGKLQGKRILDPSFSSFSDIITAVSANKTTITTQDQNAVAEKMADGFDDAQLEKDIKHAVEVVGATPADLPLTWLQFPKYVVDHLPYYGNTMHVVNTLKQLFGGGDEKWSPWGERYSINGDPAEFWQALVKHAQEDLK